jgi:hypothetical protein
MTDNSLSQPNLVLYLSFMYDTNLNRNPPPKKGPYQAHKETFVREREVRDRHKVPLQYYNGAIGHCLQSRWRNRQQVQQTNPVSCVVKA